MIVNAKKCNKRKSIVSEKNKTKNNLKYYVPRFMCGHAHNCVALTYSGYPLLVLTNFKNMNFKEAKGYHNNILKQSPEF